MLSLLGVVQMPCDVRGYHLQHIVGELVERDDHLDRPK